MNYHVDFPIISAGLANLEIEKGRAPTAMDGNIQSMGVTASTGVILELADFQLGIVVGVDRATGALATAPYALAVASRGGAAPLDEACIRGGAHVAHGVHLARVAGVSGIGCSGAAVEHGARCVPEVALSSRARHATE